MDTFFCLFEQSGTFKNALIKLGCQAFDFDIQNEYGQTDFVWDLFDCNIIDALTDYAAEHKIKLLMFFPCTYFSASQILWTRGVNDKQKSWSMYQKLEKSASNIQETAYFYCIFCYWVKSCIKKNIPLIIENPYNPQSFLLRYFPIQPTIIDKDRRRFGDKFNKPTMYYFINCKPKDNLTLLHPTLFEKNKLEYIPYGKKRSEISGNYAENFIKTYIL